MDLRRWRSSYFQQGIQEKQMSELTKLLSDAEEMDLDEIRDQYRKSNKMLFALIDSIGETVSSADEIRIYKRFTSLIGPLS